MTRTKKRLGRRLASGAIALALTLLPGGIGTAVASADPVSGGPAPVNLNSVSSFADSFAQATALDTDPMYGLNVGLGQRQTLAGGQAPISYTRVSGRWDTTTPPSPWLVQTSHPAHPDKLAFFGEISAVMLGAPAIADAGGHYTVSTTIDPVEGDTSSKEWGSIVLSRSHRSTGYVTNSDVDLGLTVASNGKLELFHGGGVGEVPFWTGNVAPGAGVFTVALTVSTGADRLVSLTVNGNRFDVPAPAAVTRWPGSSYLYLGAYLSSGEVTTFGDGSGHGLAVSNVDTSVTSSPKPLVDTFDGASNATADFGLDNDLSARQPSLVSADYTLVSGAPGLPPAPAARSAQVNNPAYPNVLSFPNGPAAVRLNKPATSDLSGAYTVHAVLTPVVGSLTSTDWSSLVVSNSPGGTGWIEGLDVALGLRIRANGGLQLFQRGTAYWATEQTVPAAASYTVSVTVASGDAKQATVVVNGTTFTVQAPAELPRDGYVYLGSHPSATGQAGTVDDLRVSMLGGLDYYGYFDIMDRDDPNFSANHTGEVAPWTNMNQFIAQDPAKGYLDYCLPASCIVDAGYQVMNEATGRPNPDAPARLAALRASIGSNIDKVAAIYMIDEPYCGSCGHHLNEVEVQTAVNQIQAAFPGKMILLTMDVANVGTTLPGGVDLVGFDIYCLGRATVQEKLALFKHSLASQDQHLVLFPESSNATTPRGPVANNCPGVSDATIAGYNSEYRAIAANDPRVVYLLNFRWLGPQQFTEMPQTVQKQRALGSAVINATKSGPADSVGVYRPSDLRFNEGARNGVLIGSPPFGVAGDVPLTGHWSGPGVDTIGVYHRATAVFTLSTDNAGPGITAHYGDPGDIPLVGDWDGNGTDTIGVYRPGNQTFYLSNDNATPTPGIKMGDPDDTPIVGDWDGNGTDTIGVYRPGTQMFYLSDTNSAPNVDHRVKFGNADDVPIKGDWDGSGVDTVGVYRPGDQTFYGAAFDTNVVIFGGVRFGNPDDRPLVGNWG